MCDELFPVGRSVCGKPLFDFLDWTKSSSEALSGTETVGFIHAYGLLTLPPVQRSAVWRPKQVIELWDSLFRGLPIGSFFLVRRDARASALTRGWRTADGMIATPRHGFDLLDGQQRTRAMLLGMVGPVLEERFLWVELGAATKRKRLRIHMTSASQPFGYDPAKVERLSLQDRRKAREEFDRSRLETGQPLQVRDTNGNIRPVYDHEIFGLTLRRCTGSPSTELPQPFRVEGAAYPLHELLSVWRSGGKANLRQFISAHERNAQVDEEDVSALDAAFGRVAAAEVALMLVDPTRFEDGADEASAHESLLMLFDRIGAGGTALTAEERLFSILKHHEPLVHDAVLSIYQSVGRVMPATKIVASGLRLANALSGLSLSLPDVQSFAKIMRGTHDGAASFKRELYRLIPTRDHQTQSDDAGSDLLTRSFMEVRKLLEYDCKDGNPLGLPKVALVELPPDLWQVLLFWAAGKLDSGWNDDQFHNSREELIRFAMFWRLCVFNASKASNWAFEELKRHHDNPAFPGRTLYRIFVSGTNGDPCAYHLLPSDLFREYTLSDKSPIWRSYDERFKPVGAPVGFTALSEAWWYGGKKLLPWLQRSYLAKTFPAYDPLSDHDDDLPFDLDHICPQSDWGANLNGMKSWFVGHDDNKKAMAQWRFLIGNAIGNQRIIDSSRNRADGNRPICDKLAFLGCNVIPIEGEPLSEVDMAFNPDHRALWKAASGDQQRWDDERLAMFQMAVEVRTVWLYQCFYEELGFSDWVESDDQNIL